MSTVVNPRTFQFVSFDADLTASVVDSLHALLGLDRPVRVEVDETTPLARIRTEIGDEIVLHVESGALEDTRKPRQQSEAATTANLGRALLRARDRISGGFGEAPPDDQLDLRQVAAWDTYAVGRLERLGIAANQQRWKYNFRNRHGFTDAADAGFERIWASDGLTWGELESLSTTATATI